MLRSFALASLVLLLPPGLARAQTASEAGAARELFRQGLEAIEAERWDEARDYFERSYALVPRSSTLVNLAAAQVELGLLVEARESYRTFLANPGRAEPLVEDTRLVLEALEPRIPHARIAVEGLEEGDEVRLDGEPISTAALGTRLPMNPGTRRVEVRRDGEVVGSASFELGESEDREVTVPVTARAVGPVGSGPEAGGSGGVDDDVWLWVGVGVGAALLVGGAIAIGVAATTPRDPYVGNLGPGMVTF